jgi:hypothetical protein
MLLAIRNLMQWAVNERLVEADPTLGIKIKLPDTGGHHTWTDEEIAQFQAHYPIRIELMLCRPSAHERRRDHNHATEDGHRSHAASQPVSTASNRSLPELALDFPDDRDRQAVLRARIQQVVSPPRVTHPPNDHR